MKTTERFNDAVTKLYIAYHNDTLNAFDCKACAVGTILGHEDWFGLNTRNLMYGDFDYNSVTILTYFPEGEVYSPEELQHIEYHFLRAWNNKIKTYCGFDKQLQFDGLCNVIEYLAEIDGIPNPFDFNKLFSDVEEIRVKELQLIN